MPSFTLRASFLAGGVLVGLAGAVSSEEATAQHSASVPDFYSKGVGWYGVGDFIAVPGGPRLWALIRPTPTFRTERADSRHIGFPTSPILT